MRRIFPLCALALFLIKAPAATLTVTPATVEAESRADIRFQIGGLTTAETITIERVVDANNNGLVDRGEIVVELFKVKDNEIPSIAGIANLSVPSDRDPANGTITTKRNFAAGREYSQSSGQFIFRATTASGTALAPFAVTQKTFPQKVSGTVRSGGAAVPGAMVALLEAGDNDPNFIAGAISDQNGNYTLNAAAGIYGLQAFKPGYLSNFQQAVPIVLAANQNKTADLTLEVSTGATVNGKFVDENNSALGLPLGQIYFSNDEGFITLAVTAPDGSFSVKLPPGEWQVEPSDNAVSSLGYVGPNDDFRVEVLSADITRQFALRKGTSLIYGTIARADNQAPMPGIDLSLNQSSGPGVETSTDAEGKFAVAVLPQGWSTQVSSDSAEGYLFSSGNFLQAQAGQAHQVQIKALPATATIQGSVKTASGAGVPEINVFASSPINGFSYQANSNTDDQGNFTLGVVNGSWNAGVSSGDLTDAGFQPLQNQTVNVQGTATVQFIASAPSAPTAQIKGQVLDENGTPIPSIRVIAYRSQGPSTQAETDQSGNFNMPANGGAWTVQLEYNDGLSRGYISPSIQVNVPNVGEATVNLRTPRATRRIRGSLKTSDNSPVAGVWIYGSTTVSGVSYNTSNQTSADGSFDLPSFPGDWWVNANSFDLQQRGFLPIEWKNVTVAGSDLSLALTAPRASSSIRGKVVDDQGTPVTFINIFAIKQGSPSSNVQTDSQGFFRLDVQGGAYSVQLSAQEARDRGLLTPMVSVAVAEGATVDNLTIVARRFSANITGRIENSNGVGIPDVTICANKSEQNTSYNNSTKTDSNGNYSLGVTSGEWSLSACGGELETLGYLQPDGRQVSVVAGVQSTFNFLAQRPGGLPQLSQILRLPGGGIQIRGSDFSNRSKHLEVSSDLRAWSVLQTFSATTTNIDFVDPAPLPLPARFYRIRRD